MSASPARRFDDVTLVVFSCEGRAHLIGPTLASFRTQCPFQFAEAILAHDGPMDPSLPSLTGANRLVQSLQRRGYVQSIIQTLAVVRTPFVFWLEDDWIFPRAVDLPGLHAALSSHPTWMQIRLSKVGPLAPEEQGAPIGPAGLHRSAYGFSANPNLARTELLRAGFAAFAASPRTATNTFESFLEDWVRTSGAICVVQDPGTSPAVEHSGYLESTGRQWHAAGSLESDAKLEFASGLRRAGQQPPLWRRLALAARLSLAAARLALASIFRGGRAYDLAFRFVQMVRRKE